MASTADWRKLVELDPKDGIRFSEGPECPVSSVVIKNNSELPVIYKVKTTQPENYTVCPNVGLVTASTEFKLKIGFNFGIESPVNLFLSKMSFFRKWTAQS